MGLMQLKTNNSVIKQPECATNRSDSLDIPSLSSHSNENHRIHNSSPLVLFLREANRAHIFTSCFVHHPRGYVSTSHVVCFFLFSQATFSCISSSSQVFCRSYQSKTLFDKPNSIGVKKNWDRWNTCICRREDSRVGLFGRAEGKREFV